MSDWGTPWRGGYILGDHAYGTTGNSGTAHVKSAWYEVIASASRQVDLICIQIIGGNSSIGYNMWKLIDIGIGASGSEIVWVANMLDCQNGQGATHTEMWLPCNFPAGTRFAVRAQDKGGNTDQVQCHIETWTRAGWNTQLTTVGVPETYGANAGTSSGAACVEATWSEIVSLTARNHSGFYVLMHPDDSFSHGDAGVTIDVGIGSAGSEYVVRSMVETTRSGLYPLMCWHVPVAIPANTRIAVKKTTAGGDTGDHFAVIVAY